MADKKTIDKLISLGLTDDREKLHSLVDQAQGKFWEGNSFPHWFNIGNEEGILCYLEFSTNTYDPKIMEVTLEEDFEESHEPFNNFLTIFYKKTYPRTLSSLNKAFKDVMDELEYRKSLEVTLKEWGFEPKGLSKCVGFRLNPEMNLRFANKRIFSSMSKGRNEIIMNYWHSAAYVTNLKYHDIPFIEGMMKGIRDFMNGKITSDYFDISPDISSLSAFPSRIRDRILGEDL